MRSLAETASIASVLSAVPNRINNDENALELPQLPASVRLPCATCPPTLPDKTIAEGIMIPLPERKKMKPIDRFYIPAGTLLLLVMIALVLFATLKHDAPESTDDGLGLENAAPISTDNEFGWAHPWRGAPPTSEAAPLTTLVTMTKSQVPLGGINLGGATATSTATSAEVPTRVTMAK